MPVSITLKHKISDSRSQLSFILIPKMGYLGSAWATFFSYFTMCVISYIWGAKVYQINYNLVSGLILILTAGLIVYYFSVEEFSLWKKYVLGTTFLVCYSGMFLLINKNSWFNTTLNH